MEEELVERCQVGDVDGAPFTAEERAALRYAEAMHQRPHDVPRPVLDDAIATLGEGRFMELAFVVAQFIGMGQLVHLMGVPNPDVVPPELQG